MSKRSAVVGLCGALLACCSVAFGAGDNSGASFFQVQLLPVPEPGSLVALASGIGGIWIIAKCRRHC